MHAEKDKLHNYVYSSEMVEFVTAANRYCLSMEQLQETNGKDFIERSIHQLTHIYASVIETGDTDPLLDFQGDPTVTELDWSVVDQRISLLLGPHNDYLRPAGEEEYDRSELVTHTISEDMADIYQELKDFTVVFSRGMEELMNDAAWQVKERFAEHWGRKLLLALTALHDLHIKGVDPGEEL